MNNFALFTDVSVNPQHRLGVGGYLFVPTSFLDVEPHDIDRGEVSARLKIKRFTDTSSTKLEVQTVLWALAEVRQELSDSVRGRLQIYTDSQCVAGLLGRRTALAGNDFIAKRSGLPLTNALIYRDFYAAYDQLDFQLIKVRGHCRADTHDTTQRIFSYVDREVRKALGLWQNTSGPVKI